MSNPETPLKRKNAIGPSGFCQNGCGQIKSECVCPPKCSVCKKIISECECPSKCDVCKYDKSRHEPGCEEDHVKAKEAKFLSKKLAKNKKSIKKSQKKSKSKSKRKQRKVRSAKKL